MTVNCGSALASTSVLRLQNCIVDLNLQAFDFCHQCRVLGKKEWDIMLGMVIQ